MAKLSRQRRQEIISETKRILNQYLKLAQNLSSGPVDPRDLLPIRPDVIARDVLKLSFEEREEIEGTREARTAGLYDRQLSLVVVAEPHGSGAWRFTGAHEIAHHILHPGVRHLRERPTEQAPAGVLLTPFEHEANFFAGHLLMPDKLLRALFLERFGQAMSVGMIDDDAAYALTAAKLTPSRIREMAPYERAELFARATWFRDRQFPALREVFGVSARAMALQLVDIGLIS